MVDASANPEREQITEYGRAVCDKAKKLPLFVCFLSIALVSALVVYSATSVGFTTGAWFAYRMTLVYERCTKNDKFAYLYSFEFIDYAVKHYGLFKGPVEGCEEVETFKEQVQND